MQSDAHRIRTSTWLFAGPMSTSLRWGDFCFGFLWFGRLPIGPRVGDVVIGNRGPGRTYVVMGKHGPGRTPTRCQMPDSLLRLDRHGQRGQPRPTPLESIPQKYTCQLSSRDVRAAAPRAAARVWELDIGKPQSPPLPWPWVPWATETVSPIRAAKPQRGFSAL